MLSERLAGRPASNDVSGCALSHLQLCHRAIPPERVNVRVRPRGQPHVRRLLNPVAWDFFEWTPEWRSLAERADAVCFGSLAHRCQQSRATIRQFLNALRKDATRVFDVNLRQSFYNAKYYRSPPNWPTS